MTCPLCSWKFTPVIPALAHRHRTLHAIAAGPRPSPEPALHLRARSKRTLQNEPNSDLTLIKSTPKNGLLQ
jgi:hypothetical protein